MINDSLNRLYLFLVCHRPSIFSNTSFHVFLEYLRESNNFIYGFIHQCIVIRMVIKI